jgi:hypothetical protein
MKYDGYTFNLEDGTTMLYVRSNSMGFYWRFYLPIRKSYHDGIMGWDYCVWKNITDGLKYKRYPVFRGGNL